MSPEKVEPNDPCPCGSGTRFKRCCLGREGQAPEAMDAIRRSMNVALDWLRRSQCNAVETAVSRKFSTRLGDGKFDQPGDLDREARLTLHGLMGDWLLAEAVLGVRGRNVRAAELVLGAEGSPLAPRDREWLSALMTTPLGLYEVAEIRADGGGILLRDLISENAPKVWVATHSARSIQRWDVVAARRVPFEGGHRFSAPPFWVARFQAAALLDSVRASGADAIIEHALQFLYDPSDDDDEDDDHPEGSKGFDFTRLEPMVVEFYRVGNWSRLINILAVESGVQRDGELGGWFLVNSSPGGVNTSWGPHHGMLRSISFNRKLGDESHAWLTRHAGAWITRLKRNLITLKDEDDPNPEPVEPLRKPAEAQADHEGYYRAWIDAPHLQLQGQSPRVALDDPAGRAVVLDLVKSAENRELRDAHFDEREPVDYGFLWQELGLDPSAA